MFLVNNASLLKNISQTMQRSGGFYPQSCHCKIAIFWGAKLQHSQTCLNTFILNDLGMKRQNRKKNLDCLQLYFSKYLHKGNSDMKPNFPSALKKQWIYNQEAARKTSCSSTNSWVMQQPQDAYKPGDSLSGFIRSKTIKERKRITLHNDVKRDSFWEGLQDESGSSVHTSTSSIPRWQ